MNAEQGTVVARQIFRYLAEYTQLRMQHQKTMASWEVTWADEWPESREVACALRLEPEVLGSGVILQVDKAHREQPPAPEALIAPWVDSASVRDSSLEAPRVRSVIRVPIEEDTETSTPDPSAPRSRELRLEDQPELLQKIRSYVVDRWLPWATIDREQASVQGLYSRLFSWLQRQAQLGERWELLLTLGLLRWSDPSNGDPISRPVVVVPCLIEMDSVRGTISVSTQATGAGPILELDMLPLEHRLGAEPMRRMYSLLEAAGDDVWREETAEGLLRSIVNSLSADGEYVRDRGAPELIAQDAPTISFSPALVLRRRTEKSVYTLLSNIESRLQELEVLPPGVAAVLGVETGRPEESERTTRDHSAPSVDSGMVFFPRKSNDEQRRIVERLAASRGGLIVQGPPGTGKSHTIANLVCDLLARGQRVLVTSKGSRALTVLRDMLPQEVQELCVLLLGSDRESNLSLERSIRAISQRHESWQPERSAAAQEQLLGAYRDAKSQQSTLLAAMRELREAETLEHVSVEGVYGGTLAKIAGSLRQESEGFEWLRMEVSPQVDPGECPLDPAVAQDAADSLRKLQPQDVEDARLAFPAPEDLPTPDGFRSLVRQERDARSALERLPSPARQVAWHEGLEPVLHGIANLRLELDSLTRGASSSTTPEWLLQECINGDAGRVHEISAYLQYVTATLADGRRLDAVIQLPDQVTAAQAAADAARLLHHLGQGHRLVLGPFRAKLVRECDYLPRATRIDGRLCDNPESLTALVQTLETERLIAEACASMEVYGVRTSGLQQARAADLRSLLRIVSQVQLAASRALELRAATGGVDLGFIPDWSTAEGISAVLDSLEWAAAESGLREASDAIDAVATLVNPGGYVLHPHASALLEATTNRDTEAYAKSWRELCELEERRKQVDEIDRLRQAVTTVSGGLASALFQWGDCEAARRLESLPLAWKWLRASCWLERVSDPGRYEELSAALENNQVYLEETMARLAAELAWNHCLSGMTDGHQKHLFAWSYEMKKLGKGTGKYASVHRERAREHMQQCKDVIPAWIMPMYMIAETLDPQPNMFDVAIVDEASQCGPESLFVAYIAKKVIIVGDDQQISPDDVGIKVDAVEALMDLHLEDMPFKGVFGARSSLFDQGKQFFGHPLRLREHFRCMPEIIQFCNSLCYADQPLEPLRQYGDDRLEPVRVQYVTDGEVDGGRTSVVNHREAMAIVEQIAAMCRDPRYEDKSIGVISLLSSSRQAAHIQNLLQQHIGVQEMSRRRLICGDAYDFQGDERDVIVLSMVSAPNRRIGPLTSEADKRRFNVAVSRAKDQLWLFHSATLEDLSQHCLRRQLLKYCQNPQVNASEVVGGIDVEKVRRSAELKRTLGSQPAPFDSWFEVDVFLAIIDKGYRAIPQYPSGGYHIDLLVQGMRGSLAIECDGEAWHGPERYEADLARQRKLERCGLRFWRVRESAFRMNPEAALEDLWARLASLRIYPSGEEEGSDQPVDSEGKAEDSRGPLRPDSGHVISPPVEQPRAPFIDLGLDIGARVGVSLAERKASSVFSTDGLVEADETSPLSRGRSAQDRSTPELTPLTSARRTQGGIRLAPYTTWKARPMHDPRDGLRPMVEAGLLEIVETEGPVSVDRLYKIYAQAAGIARVKSHVRAGLDAALSATLRSGSLTRTREGLPGLEDVDVVHLSGKPDVVARERGARELEDVPPSEMLAVLRRLVESDPDLALDEEAAIRRLQSVYEIGRLGQKVEMRFRSIVAKNAMRRT